MEATFLTLAGALIAILLAVLGFFLGRVINDVRKNTTDIGKNKGGIELVRQQQINDTKRLEERTQLELKTMSAKIGQLTDSVNLFVTALAKKGLDNE